MIIRGGIWSFGVSKASHRKQESGIVPSHLILTSLIFVNLTSLVHLPVNVSVCKAAHDITGGEAHCVFKSVETTLRDGGLRFTPTMNIDSNLRYIVIYRHIFLVCKINIYFLQTKINRLFWNCVQKYEV